MKITAELSAKYLVFSVVLEYWTLVFVVIALVRQRCHLNRSEFETKVFYIPYKFH